LRAHYTDWGVVPRIRPASRGNKNGVTSC
jgi:hypothetical protein